VICKSYLIEKDLQMQEMITNTKIQRKCRIHL